MAVDTTLLKVMKHRKEYEKLKHVVEKRAISEQTRVIVKDFGRYLDEFEVDTIPLTGEFITWFTVRHPTLTDENMRVYERVFKNASKDVDPEQRESLMYTLLEAGMAVDIEEALARYEEGEEIDLGQFIRTRADEFEAEANRKVRTPLVEHDDALFEEEENHIGIQWRWEGLNRVMRPMVPGDFILIAGRPDKGKTTAISDNATYWASQLDQVFDPEERRGIMWLNNEGPGKRILKRCINSALGLPVSKLVELRKKGKLWSEYEKALGADRGRLEVYDVHGFKSWQIEDLIRRKRPGIIIFDMIDNIQWAGDLSNGGTRTDQLLEQMYQWARGLGVVHEAIIVATSQISADGDGVPYPTLSMLKDSKTGKQGAADAIITIGAKNEAGFENLRFIGCTKNKLAPEGQPRSPKAEMMLDGPAGRYLESAHND